MAFSMKPLNFCKLVYISAIISTFSSLLETSGPRLSLEMKRPEDFEYFLSWKAGNSSRTPACYTVMYKESNVDCNLPTMGTELKSAVRGQEQVNSYNNSRQVKYSLEVDAHIYICPDGLFTSGGSSFMVLSGRCLHLHHRHSLFPPTRSQQSQDPDHHVLGPWELATCPALSEADAQSPEIKYVLRWRMKRNSQQKPSKVGPTFWPIIMHFFGITVFLLKKMYSFLFLCSFLKSSYQKVQECTHITRPFCNLTNEFADFCKGYMIIIVIQYTSNGINYSDGLSFSPYFSRCFRPPQFNISVCQSCVNVTVKLSPLLLKVYQELHYTITVETADIKENRIDNKTKHDSFFTVLEDLHPNKNYCIAVHVYTVHNKQCTSTIPKCVMIDSNNRQDHIILSILAVLMVLVVVLCLFILHKTGFIFLKRKKWPRVLIIKHSMAYSIFGSDVEEVHNVQVQESKEQQHSEDEDSESDVESNFDTKCGTLNEISKFFSEVDITQKLSIGCSATTNELTRTLDNTTEKNQNDIDKGSPITQLYPSEVNSTHGAESERRGCLNVNLNTVMLGILDEKLDFSTTFDHEDIPDLKESCISDAFEPNHFTEMPDRQSFDVQSPLCSWENLSGSEDSESSDSETECTTGYMRR
ncbi:interferon alpha/beta receptor 2-like [Candoia aspera]|uniref:interferon alpha/beta receptor 2-like n=1 Tax=Candoia aspera TaxID=51853 RepID=UPI002FD838AE